MPPTNAGAIGRKVQQKSKSRAAK